MKYCISFQVSDQKLHYIRAYLSGSKIIIENEGTVVLDENANIDEHLLKIVRPEDYVCIALESKNTLIKHVITPKLRGNQVRRMARNQLDSHLLGLESGPYDCDTIELNRDKKHCHWLLIAQKRADIEDQLRVYSSIKKVNNGFKIKGLDELFQRVIQTSKQNYISLYMEGNQCTLYYYSETKLCFVKRSFLSGGDFEKELADEINRSCLLRELNLPEVVYASGPQVDLLSDSKLSHTLNKPVKTLKLKQVEGELDQNEKSSKLALLGLAWLRLSDQHSHNIYHEEGEQSNQTLNIQKSYCVPLILLMVFLGVLFLKNTFLVKKAESEIKSLYSQAKTLYYKAMPNHKSKFSDKSYYKILSNRYSKEFGSQQSVKLKNFLKNVQSVTVGKVNFLMTGLNFQPTRGKHTLQGHVKNLKDFESLNQALAKIKNYVITSNFRKPSKGSDLGLKVSLTFEVKK